VLNLILVEITTNEV